MINGPGVGQTLVGACHSPKTHFVRALPLTRRSSLSCVTLLSDPRLPLIPPSLCYKLPSTAAVEWKTQAREREGCTCKQGVMEGEKLDMWGYPVRSISDGCISSINSYYHQVSFLFYSTSHHHHRPKPNHSTDWWIAPLSFVFLVCVKWRFWHTGESVLL